MRHRFLGIALLAGILSMASAFATPIPAIDVPAMTSGADFIVVGRANRVESQNDLTQTFSVSVDHVLKGGETNPPKVLNIRLDVSQPGHQTVSQRQYGMFFLRRAKAGGSYTAVDPFHAVLVASPASDANAAGSTDLLGAVTRALVQVFTAPPASLLNPQTGIQHLAVAEPVMQLQQIYLAAAEAIRSIPYDTAGAELRRIAETGQPTARLWSLNCLFFMGDSDNLEALKVNYLDSLKPVLINPPPDLAPAVSSLVTSMEGHLKSPTAVPTLAALLHSSEVAVRRAAASVLSDIATQATIAPLAKIALNDPDQNVRYYAVLGLATATGTGEAPAMDRFDKHEAEMITRWRSWARFNVP
jgi:HEAT repeats